MLHIALAVTSQLLSPQGGAQVGPDAPTGQEVAAHGDAWHGVAWHDGAVRAVGADYAARFDAGGVTFTAALGARAPSPVAVHCRVEHVRRGTTLGFERTQDVLPGATDKRVCYQLSPWLDEVYEVRAEGVEQSFVFAQRPAGSGDLVVSLRIATDLAPAVERGDLMRYERLGVGGIEFGAVTGIDANGARAAGSLHRVGDRLELSLPASFVDTAAYPLVLDPMIGSTVTIGNGSAGVDRQPSVAFDETTQRYLVVWNVEVSATSAELWAQFVTALGSPIGNPIMVDGNTRTGLRPAVANVNDANRFLLAWGRAAMQGTTSYTQARYAAMSASNGALSSSTHFAGSTLSTPNGLAIGGNSRQSLGAIYDEALVVCTLEPTSSSGTGTAHSWLVHVPVSGNPVSVGVTNFHLIAGTGDYGWPAVTKHAGNGGRWMVAVSRTFGGASAIEGFFVGSNGSTCHHATIHTQVFSGGGSNAVATRDGYGFLVASGDPISGQIRTFRCAYTGGCGTGTTTIGIPQDPVQATSWKANPELECVGVKYVLSWESATSSTSQRDIRVRALDVVNGTPIGATYYAGGSSTPLLAERGSALASRWSGGDAASDEALLVWSSGVIVGRRYEATGTGTVTSLGGACGFTGLTDQATYSGTPALGTNFTIQLLAPTAPVLALIVGFSQTPIACGPCTIVPSPDLLFAGAGPVPVQVPFDANLIGFDLFTQWLQWRPSGCSLTPDFGFSNTLKFTIAE